MVKKLKLQRPDLRRALRSSSPEQIVTHLGRSPVAAVDQLFDVLHEVERWGNGDAEVRAALVLFELGESASVVDLLLELLEDLSADHTGDEAVVLGRLVFTTGTHADPGCGAQILEVLDDAQLRTGRLPVGFDHMIELLVRFHERGFVDDGVWRWLERLRPIDLELWCCLAGHVPGGRTIPLLQRAIDEHDGAADTDPMAADVVASAVAALEKLGAARPLDLERGQRLLKARGST